MCIRDSLRADRNLFARMIIIAESRNLQMQNVLKHPLGPLPASLACNNGFPHKTNKAQLGKELEKLIQPTVEVTRPSAYLIDGMALVQKLNLDYLTFGEIADKRNGYNKTSSQETGRQGAVCNMWKPMLQDHCRESRGRRRAKIRTRGG